MKQHIPLIVLVVLIALGIGLLVYEKTEAPVVPEPSTATTTESVGGDSVSTAPPYISMPVIPVSPSAPAVEAVIWKVYTNPDWGVSLRYQPEWKFWYATSTKNGRVTQVSFSGPDGSVMVSKDVVIAEPSLLEYSTHVETIAGQEVKVHEYTNPNEDYAYYLYFALEADDDIYYFSVKSVTKVKAAMDAFIDRITVN